MEVLLIAIESSLLILIVLAVLIYKSVTKTTVIDVKDLQANLGNPSKQSIKFVTSRIKSGEHAI